MDDELMTDLLAAVDQQLASPETAYVKEAFERIAARGMTGNEAKKPIAELLGVFTDRMLEEREPFDEEGYREALAALGEG